MNINRLRRHWDALGKTDPLWANLTNDDKRGGKWDVEEFFLTGEQEIQEVIDFVGSLSVPFEHDRALDFGCGVGRLTQALAARFDDVWGIDIAPSMIELANRYNRYPGTCHYYLNERSDLSRFDDRSFDFIYSNIVLQHMQPKDQRRYLTELIRVLADGGLFVFQLPSAPLPAPGPKDPWQRLKGRIRSITPSLVLVPYRRVRRELTGLWRGPRMEMWGLPEHEVRRYLGSRGAEVISVTPDLMAYGWSGFRYVVTR
ncbi:MAG: class I SAM-dependent methyltransferase [Actinomycetota bacterium]|nr:class I SAM-dependent methyltransferase [Actinomycetota bacterium]